MAAHAGGNLFFGRTKAMLFAASVLCIGGDVVERIKA